MKKVKIVSVLALSVFGGLLAGNGYAGTTAKFTVTAKVVPACTISADPNLNFANVDSTLQAGAVNSQTNIYVTCTSQLPYWVGLNGGQSQTSTRAMIYTNAGSTYSLPYSLYQDIAYGSPWGNTKATGLNKTGIGIQDKWQVYGQINYPITPSIPAGNYTDTITATVNY